MQPPRRPSELIIRPGLNDHNVTANLLAPGGSSIALPDGRPLVSRVVLDGHIAVQRPLFVQAAASAGIPCLIDPLTPLLQGELRPQDRWALLPFGRSAAVRPADLETESARQELVEGTVDFEVEVGATAVISPYPYVSSPEDDWYLIALDLLRRTGAYMDRSGIHLPLIAPLSAQLQSFGNPKNWAQGLDRFCQASLDVEASAIALCLSPAGAASDSYHKVLHLFLAVERVVASGVPVLAWHQGIYGTALTAIGARGYETGIGISEQSNTAQSIASRRPQEDGQKREGGAVAGVFLSPLGRSVPMPIGQALLGDLRLRAKVMCDDENCCPLGPTSTLDRNREHAVRARARDLLNLDEMPQRNWRLHRIARDARAAETLIGQANKTLKEMGMAQRIGDRSANSLANVADYLTDTHTQQLG